MFCSDISVDQDLFMQAEFIHVINVIEGHLNSVKPTYVMQKIYK
jgi:hypothetical protein